MQNLQKIVAKGAIGVFPEGNSMNGLFFLLKNLHGVYQSCYSVEAEITAGDITSLYRYHETQSNSYFYTSESKNEVTITFNNTLILSNYSLSNSADHTAPSSWYIYGVDTKGVKHELDKEEDQYFCDEGNTRCQTSVVKTYATKKQIRVKSIIIKQIKAIDYYTYLLLRSAELFGVICTSEFCSSETLFEKFKAKRYVLIISVFFIIIVA